MSKNKCEICGATCDEEKCFKHKKRKHLPKISTKDTQGGKKDTNLIDEVYTRNLFFASIWNKRPRKSEISEKSLGFEILTVFFHHILPKNKYPQAEFDEENIILLTLEEHEKVEADMYFYEEINKRREKLKLKYNL